MARRGGALSVSASALSFVVLLGAAPATALENGLARTPPMGWNSWNKFGCNVSEGLIKKTAEAMIESGMRDAGYTYVNIDDCWQGERSARGYLMPDPKRFPSGMAALGDYLHARGLKFGIYSDAGPQSCAKRPGSLGYEEKDAEQFATWGIDSLKYDWCNTDGLKAEDAYAKMRDALAKTRRPILFGICEWGTSRPWTWAANVGNTWRTTGDIGICWDRKACKRSWETGVMNILDLQVGLEAYAGPGRFNDPDVLQVGNGLTATEDKSHFSLWALLAAPLLAGNDLSTMSKATRDILTNAEVIAVNQDPLARQGEKLRDDGDEEVWAKPLAGGAFAVILLNRNDTAVRIKVRFSDLGWPDGTASVRDLWLHQDLGVFKDSFFAEVDPHGVVMVRLTKKRSAYSG